MINKEDIMSPSISLKDAERRVFQTAINDGLWDIYLGCLFLMLVIAPQLSPSLGDFWSSAVFLPFFGLVYLVLRWIRKEVVLPRIGQVQFGPARKSRLMRFNLILLVFNLLAFILGVLAALSVGRVPGQLMGFGLGLQLLVAFNLAGYLLDLSRLYLYGLLAGIAPPIGEWLWSRGLVSHHGYPLTFGVVSGVMIVVGLALFARLLRSYPAPEDLPIETA
jgi:hypothetical protein